MFKLNPVSAEFFVFCDVRFWHGQEYCIPAHGRGFGSAVESTERNMRDARTTFSRELRTINTEIVESQTRLVRFGPAMDEAFFGVSTIMRSGLSGAAAGIVKNASGLI